MNNYESRHNNGILYIIGTPIGNLEDITYRAVRILGKVDLIACEDTRHTKILLDRYNINKPLVSYHQHSQITKIDYLINELKAGKNIALVTDAGTPGISDPGGFLVQKTIEQCNLSTSLEADKITIIPIPGPSAITTLLSVSGMPTDSFLFLGFLPKKKGRQTLFRNLLKASGLKLFEAIVFYESPHRIVQTLKELQLSVGNYDVVIGRELTKQFEEIYRGKIGQAITYFDQKEPRGEFTVVLRTTPTKYQQNEILN
ncbi:MAG: hypothetical protein ACD_58C00084G0005 [uncultured bacterium]|nr:MAG: hypothetical protein ACD_58C00084G0005 [uncultured bacterium]